jgi:hypothetical protein
MRDSMREAVKAYYRKEMKRIHVPDVPEGLIPMRLPIRERLKPFMAFGAAACLMVAVFLTAKASGAGGDGLARLITETGLKYEWCKQFDAGNGKIPQAFTDAFTHRF